MDKLPHISNLFYNEPAISAGEKFRWSVSQMDKVFLHQQRGTEAIEGAYKDRESVMPLQQRAWHRITDHCHEAFLPRQKPGALSLTGNDHYTSPSLR